MVLLGALSGVLAAGESEPDTEEQCVCFIQNLPVLSTAQVSRDTEFSDPVIEEVGESLLDGDFGFPVSLGLQFGRVADLDLNVNGPVKFLRDLLFDTFQAGNLDQLVGEELHLLHGGHVTANIVGLTVVVIPHQEIVRAYAVANINDDALRFEVANRQDAILLFSRCHHGEAVCIPRDRELLASARTRMREGAGGKPLEEAVAAALLHVQINRSFTGCVRIARLQGEVFLEYANRFARVSVDFGGRAKHEPAVLLMALDDIDEVDGTLNIAGKSTHGIDETRRRMALSRQVKDAVELFG